MKLWLVRHARPLIDPGVCYGATDIPAYAQATAVQAHQLAEVLPAGVPVYCSPLRRCESLALALCGLRPDLTYESDARLREMDFGTWEGRPWSDIPKNEFDHWMGDFGQHRVGGGENVDSLVARVALALQHSRERAAAADDVAQGSAVWITHAGVIRAVTLLIQGPVKQLGARQWPREAPGYGQWLVLSL